MSYLAKILPDIYAQGSTFGAGFDTRIIQLESGHEHRTARSGLRRRYEVNLNIFSTDDLYQLYLFYVAVARGALNAFKFKDWLDYATTISGVTHNDEDITEFDNALQFAGGRTYRLVKTYQSQGESFTRFLRKPRLGKVLFAVNGAPTVDYVLDSEEGLVTFGGALGAIATATFGCEFFTQVRFTKDTDDAFEIALLGPDTGELPSISLVEDLTEHGWSMEFPAGGSFVRVLPADSGIVLNQHLGKLWHIEPVDNLSYVKLPDLFQARAGGPHFLVFNGSLTFTLNMLDQGDLNIGTIPALGSVELWIAVDTAGDLLWVVS